MSPLLRGTLCAVPGLILAVSAPVARADKIVDVAPGYVHSCALSELGHVYCWGMEQVNGGPASTTSAHRVEGLPTAMKLASGHVNSCILDSVGAVWCWGLDLQASVRERHATVGGPVRVTGLPPASMVASGHLHSCIVAKADGSVWCWGANPAGELGDGSKEDRAEPVRAGELEGVTSLSTGINNTCATDATGAVHCWGTDLQSGEGEIVKQASPTQVDLPGHMVRIANGRNFFCGLTDQKAVICFGSNIMNQLGDDRLGPVYATASPRDLAPAEDIGAGGFYACARHAFGALSCWGHLPDNDDPTHNGVNPMLVPGITDVVDLGTGTGTACALRRDGTVLCWGNNQSGQVGNGRTADIEVVPSAVKGLPSSGTSSPQTSAMQPHSALSRAETDRFLRKFMAQEGDARLRQVFSKAQAPGWWSTGGAHGQVGDSQP